MKLSLARLLVLGGLVGFQLIVPVQLNSAYADADSISRQPMQVASQLVNDTASQTIALLKSDSDQNNVDKELSALLDENFDIDAFSKFVLGRAWFKAPPQQREEYLRLFKPVFVRAYASCFSQYPDAKVQIQTCRPSKSGLFVVSTRLIQASGVGRLEWSVAQVKNKFKIGDVIVNGVSLSITQRAQVASMLQDRGGSVEKLLEAMRQQAASSK